MDFRCGSALRRENISWTDCCCQIAEQELGPKRTAGTNTALLDQTSLRIARKTAPPALRKPLERLSREWSALNRAQTDDYAVHAGVPARLQSAAQNLISAMTEQLAEARPPRRSLPNIRQVVPASASYASSTGADSCTLRPA